MMEEDDLVEALKAVAHPLRLKILRALRKGELNVGEIDERTEIGQPALSQQLGVLRKSGLVDTRKDAKMVYYSLAEEPLDQLAGAFGELAGAKPSSSPPTRTPAPGAAHFARLS